MSNKEIVRKIIRLFYPFRSKVILIMLCILASSGVSLLLPLFSQVLMDKGLIQKNIEITIRYSVFCLLLVLITQLISIIETKICSYLENMIVFLLEKDAIHHLLNMRLSFFKNKNYAQTMNNLKTDIGKVAGICNRNSFFIITSIFRMIIGAIGLVIISWKLSLIVLLVAPIRYILVKFFSRKKESEFKNYLELQDSYFGWQGDTFAGIREVKSSCLEGVKIRQFIKMQRNIIRNSIVISELENLNVISEELCGQVITTLVYIIASFLIAKNQITVGMLFAFVTYASYVTQPMFALMNIKYLFAGIIPSARRYFEFLNLDCEEKKGVYKKRLSSSVLGKIEFRNVCFSYNETETILNKISFVIQPGEHVAIIGGNGAGKSTIIELLMRFLEQNSGEIFLDDMDIRQINLKDYRKNFSIVSQEIFLFNMSIQENIILAAKKTEEEFDSIVETCGISHLQSGDFACRKDGVGERGAKLSGGERQKIAMARALIKESQVLILDEATANYDSNSEMSINQVIAQEYKDKTVIIITHKPDILEMMDKVIVINHGCIEDIGTPYELHKRNKYYRQMAG